MVVDQVTTMEAKPLNTPHIFITNHEEPAPVAHKKEHDNKEKKTNHVHHEQKTHANKKEAEKHQVNQKPAEHKAVPQKSAWGNKQINNLKAKTATKGQSHGKGSSQLAAGPQGAQSQAKGSKGSSTAANFDSEDRHAHDNWGVTKTGNKADAWVSKGLSDQKTAGKTQGTAFGSGNAGSKTGREGSQAFGNGKKGTKSGASWKAGCPV